MVKALIGLGSNLGNPVENLTIAKTKLSQLPSTELVSISEWLNTNAIGGPTAQNEFLNGAVLLSTVLEPDALADELHRIETDLGRERIVRWGPRLIDLDIVLYGDRVIDTPRLTIPHPWMAVRRFVLEPASQIAASMLHPQIGLTVGELFDNLTRQPTRIEMTGLPSVDTAAIAKWLIDEVDGVSAFPGDSTRNAIWSFADGLSLATAIELLENWSQSLVNPANPQTNETPATVSLNTALPENADAKTRRGEAIIVSDRWCEEILVAGKLYLNETDFIELENAWQRIRQDTAWKVREYRRKLLVVLTNSRDSAGEKLELVFWNRVHSPGHGPWLVLDTTDCDKMRHDLLAVVNGMK